MERPGLDLAHPRASPVMMSTDDLVIECFGHAAFALTTSSGTLLIDPHAPGLFGGQMDYPQIPNHADAVICTHDHLDHCATDAFDAPILTDQTQWRGWFIDRIEADHDEFDGTRRGGQVDMLHLKHGPWSIVHASDLGQSPEPHLLAKLGRPDIFIVPVGGFFTIGAAQAWSWCTRLNPRCILPMHFRTTRCHLPIADHTLFTHYMEDTIDVGPTLALNFSQTLPTCAIMVPDGLDFKPSI